MNIKYIKLEESKYQVIQDFDPNKLRDHLPAGVYTIDYNPMTRETKLVKKNDDFPVPQKTFGQSQFIADRIVAAFKTGERAHSFLFGDVGSGKSLTAEMVCNQMLKMGIPVIIVDRRFPTKMLEDITNHVGPSVLYIDEFDLIYTGEDQEMFVPFLSSSLNNNSIVIMTSNDVSNNRFKSRPNRVGFNVNFTNNMMWEMWHDVLLDNDCGVKDPVTRQWFIDYYIANWNANSDMFFSAVKVEQKLPRKLKGEERLKELLRTLRWTSKVVMDGSKILRRFVFKLPIEMKEKVSQMTEKLHVQVDTSGECAEFYLTDCLSSAAMSAIDDQLSWMKSGVVETKAANRLRITRGPTADIRDKDDEDVFFKNFELFW